MNVFKIDGRAYNVTVVAIEENFTILYSENTGRTMSRGARMVLDPLGTFIGHKITVRRKNGYESEYDALYDYISIPRSSGMMVDVVHGQSAIKYEAYVSNGVRNVASINSNGVKWGEMQINIIPMEAQVLPE